MPEAIVFLLRAVVLVLLWGFVVAAVIAVRHDVFGTRVQPAPAAAAPKKSPPRQQEQRRSATQLVVVEGDQSGTAVSLDNGTVTIGRDAGSTVVLKDDYASNHHAEVTAARGGAQLRDLGSTNGTYVDGKKVTGTTTVSPGSRIQIGRTVLEIRS